MPATVATLPQTTPDLTYSAPTGSILKVGAGQTYPATQTGLQNAINDAVAGDAIEITAGSSINCNNVSLPNKSGSSYIHIRSSLFGNLPIGTRVSSADVSNMAALVQNVADGKIFYGATQSHHWRFVGIELKISANTNTFVSMERDVNDTTFASAADRQHHWIFDRCYLHGVGSTNYIRHGIMLGGDTLGFVDSDISNVFSRTVEGLETHALLFQPLGLGFHARNCRIEGAGMAVLMGGFGGWNYGENPRDVTFDRCLFTANPAWNPQHPSYAGTTMVRKNVVELKLFLRVLFKGCIFENSWSQAQTGQILNINTLESQHNAAYVSNDLTIQDCWARHGAYPFDFTAGYDGGSGNGNKAPLRRITVKNVLCTDCKANAIWDWSGGGNGKFLSTNCTGLQGAGYDIGMKHITAFHTRAINNGGWNGTAPDAEIPNFEMKDNIVAYGSFGIREANTGNMDQIALNADAPGWEFDYNLVIGSQGGLPTANNQYPASEAAVGWTDEHGSDTTTTFDDIADLDGYVLSGGSSYKNDASDGTDPGVNIATLKAALQGQDVPSAAAKTHRRIGLIRSYVQR